MTLFSVVMLFCVCPFQRGETRRGTIYGLGNLQYKNKRPSESVPAALKRDIDIEMRVSGLESLTQEIKFDVHALKTDFNEGIARISQLST